MKIHLLRPYQQKGLKKGLNPPKQKGLKNGLKKPKPVVVNVELKVKLLKAVLVNGNTNGNPHS